MPHDHHEAIALFRRGPEILDNAIAGVSEEESRFVPAPGKRTIRQIVQHLTDCEIVAGMRLRQGISEDRILRDDMSGLSEPLPAEAFEKVGASMLGEWLSRFGTHVEKHAGQIQRIRQAWSRH